MAILKSDLTAQEVRELLSIDADGVLRWRVARGRAAGSPAGVVKQSGYREVKIRGSTYRAHRLVWLIVTGRWPVELLDHINFSRDDNRFENLREASYSQSSWHRLMPKGEQGVKGVTLHKCGRFQAQIGFKGKTRYLGLFDTPDQAAMAYQRASLSLHGSFGVPT